MENTFRFSPSKVKAARGDRSQESLAAELGVTARTIENWETGESTPKANHLAALAQSLGVPITELYEAVGS